MKKIDIIRSVVDGTKLVLPLDQVTYRAFTQRVCEANKADGWRHYSISKSKLCNTLTIIAHRRED